MYLKHGDLTLRLVAALAGLSNVLLLGGHLGMYATGLPSFRSVEVLCTKT